MRATNLGTLSLFLLLAACTSQPRGGAPPLDTERLRAPEKAAPSTGVAWSFDTGG